MLSFAIELHLSPSFLPFAHTDIFLIFAIEPQSMKSEETSVRKVERRRTIKSELPTLLACNEAFEYTRTHGEEALLLSPARK